MSHVIFPDAYILGRKPIQHQQEQRASKQLAHYGPIHTELGPTRPNGACLIRNVSRVLFVWTPLEGPRYTDPGFSVMRHLAWLDIFDVRYDT